VCKQLCEISRAGKLVGLLKNSLKYFYLIIQTPTIFDTTFCRANSLKAKAYKHNVQNWEWVKITQERLIHTKIEWSLNENHLQQEENSHINIHKYILFLLIFLRVNLKLWKWRRFLLNTKNFNRKKYTKKREFLFTFNPSYWTI
jgi:hypothetical protein